MHDMLNFYHPYTQYTFCWCYASLSMQFYPANAYIRARMQFSLQIQEKPPQKIDRANTKNPANMTSRPE